MLRRILRRKTGGTLVPIASIMDSDVIKIDSEVIGIVFPVYYKNYLVIIKRFVEKLDNIENKYIFAVCTFGGSAGYSLKSLRRFIQARGGKLSATYRVHMPQNSFRKFFETPLSYYTLPWNNTSSHSCLTTPTNGKKESFSNIFCCGRFLRWLIIHHE